MVKAPLAIECVGANPTDRGKKGRKRSLLVDGRGVPLQPTSSRPPIIRASAMRAACETGRCIGARNDGVCFLTRHRSERRASLFFEYARDRGAAYVGHPADCCSYPPGEPIFRG